MIFDEAHEIEDIAGQYFGFAVSTYRVQDLRRDIAVMSRTRKFGSEELDRILIRLDEIAHALLRRRCPAVKGAPASPGATPSRSRTAKSTSDLLAAFDLLMSHLKLIKDAPQEVIPLFRRAHELRAGAAVPDRRRQIPAFVHWIERRGRGGVFLQATPIDVAEVLRQHLWDKVDAAVLTSATLAVAGALRLCAIAAGPRERPHSGCPKPFRLPVAGAAVYAEPSAEPVAARLM